MINLSSHRWLGASLGFLLAAATAQLVTQRSPTNLPVYSIFQPTRPLHAGLLKPQFIRMINQHASAPISSLELNQRQLAAWQELKQQLQVVNPDDPQIDYCDRRIAHFEEEIGRLSK